ncbi:MAG: PVC-type heme-binding CxxCH protein [Daejeonella sp.]
MKKPLSTSQNRHLIRKWRMNRMKITGLKFFPGLICCLLLTGQGCNVSIKTNRSVTSQMANPQPEKFAEHIRTTEFQTPEQERAGFKLPPGFEISLYASEPDIGKPINMEFDERGRLWVTQSSEYPMAAAPAQGHDRITILEDTNGDGRADKFTPFAEDLNIPIGIIPVKNGAIAFSIPNVYRFTDRDGDGKADDKKVILGEFGHRDTHGMVNNFIRGFDGWIYACHGFTNTSTIAGTDGDSIKMVSGNTFRFRPDGSRVEQTTYGRVNPFGYTFDEWGYLYSVDCHSKPIYQLIRGGDYPHFGKKSPAMGYAPEMMSYELGSTALSGLVYYSGEQFPEPYRNSFYSGDVVTCRINRNTMSFSGASPEATRQKDFLISADPWFRPVNIKTGPDGALYIADFYNRIIGHYEVPLNHPGRDRQSGRIWRITYVGDQKHKNHKSRDWSKASISELVKNLNYPQLNLRMMIANQLVEGYKEKAIGPVSRIMKTRKTDTKSYIQGLWILFRLQALPDDILDQALNHRDPVVRVHAYRILTEKKVLPDKYLDMALKSLADTNMHVQRVAAEVLGNSPDIGNVEALLAMYNKAGEKDTHLKYTALLAVRENLRNNMVMQKVVARKWKEEQLNVLVRVIRDVPSKEAALFAMEYLQNHDLPYAGLVSSLEYIGRYIEPGQLIHPISFIQKKFPGDLDAQYMLYNTMQQGLQQRGGTVISAMKLWGISLAEKSLENLSEESNAWSNRPLEQTGDPENPWSVINRAIVAELPSLKLIWSEHNWYAPTGILVSPSFKLPASLEMSIFDNDVHNTKEKTGISKNSVRIRLTKTRKPVAEYRGDFRTAMTAKDLIRPVKFDLEAYRGQQGYIEVIDSTKTGSVGIGGIKPAVIAIPDKGPAELNERYIRAAEIVAAYKVQALEPAMKKLVKAKWADYKSRAAAAGALMALAPQRNSALLGEILTSLDESQLMKVKIALTLGQDNSPGKYAILQKGLAGSQRNLQVAIASILVNSEPGIDYLLQSVKQGDVNFDILSELPVKERLAANINSVQQQQLDQLAVGKASESESRKQLIIARLAEFNPESVTVESGKAMFIQNCSMCHQIKGNGGMIGPQLDGIGNWGQKALTEKVLDPNRNISQAFRTYTITLNNGKILTGLYRREEGEVLVFANPGGQEFSVPKNEIKERKASQYTLMPDHFSKTIAKKDFDALLKYLLSVKE